MTFAGIARNEHEREQALMVAAASFSKPDANKDASFLRKAFLLCEHPGYSNDSPVVVCDADGRVAGSAFLIDCAVQLDNRLLRGVFISSISIAESARGQGFSLQLMDAALHVAASRGTDVALLIARRAVDRYYTRFGFWGLSQYSKVTLDLATLPSALAQPQQVSLRPATPSDFDVCGALHHNNYQNLAGHCVRNPKMWAYILGKVAYLGMRLELILADGKTMGYAIHDGNGNLHEIATDDYPCGARTILEACSPGNASITLHIPPGHPFMRRLEGADVSLTLRECPYGGHMVRVLNPALVGGQRNDVVIGDVSQRSRLSLAETARTLRLARVTGVQSQSDMALRGSLNIALLDQI